MKFSKKHIVLGSICLISAFLQSILNFSVFIPYLAFCICSFVIGQEKKKGIAIVTVLLCSFVALPVFDFIYSMLTAPLMTTLFINALFLFVQASAYLGLFILINSKVNKEKISFSLIACILTIFCVAAYSTLEGIQQLTLSRAMNEAIEQGDVISMMNAMSARNMVVDIISRIAFFAALWFSSVGFIKKN